MAGDKRLLGLPDYDIRSRTGWSSSRWEAWYEISFVGSSFLESGERNEIEARTLQGVGLGHRWASVRLGARVQNITDEEVFDFWGYPLPGRTFHLSLGWVSVL